MSDESDRRREARAPIELKVEYKRLNTFFYDYTKNISKGGTFIKTEKPLDIGTIFLFKLMLPTIFSSSVSQLNLLVGTMFASLLVVNAQSWLYYTDRLIEFPLGMFGVAIGTVILPHLSRRHADTDAAGYSHALDWGLRLSTLVSIPAALGVALLAEPLCSTLFFRGAFTAHDTRMVAVSVMAMSLGIPAFTAMQAVHLAQPAPGMRMLVSGGAGTVGHYAIQMLKRRGVEVITTVSSTRKAQHAATAGADHIVNYREEDVTARVQSITQGEGVDRLG